jgi:hypothetical protein
MTKELVDIPAKWDQWLEPSTRAYVICEATLARQKTEMCQPKLKLLPRCVSQQRFRE